MYVNLEFHWGAGPTLTRRSWQRVRRIIKIRDLETCQYCGEHAPNGEPDHILPLSRGGTDQLANLVWSCKECNRSKGDRTLREWLSSLHETPTNWLPAIDVTPHRPDVINL